MTKEELISKIADDAKITKVQAKAAMTSLIESIVKTVKKGGKISLVGFLTLSSAKRKARTGRNPQTGKPIQIKAKKVVRVKVGKTFADQVNK